MTRPYVLALLWVVLLCTTIARAHNQRERNAIEDETLRHFQALLRLDTSNPPGNEALAVEYLKQVLEQEGIAVQVFASDAKRPNLVARLKGRRLE